MRPRIDPQRRRALLVSANLPSSYAKSHEVEAEGRLRGRAARLPVPPRPRLARDRAEQSRAEMTEREQEQRDRESRESSKTKYEESVERESEERAREAEDIRELPPPREEHARDELN